MSECQTGVLGSRREKRSFYLRALRVTLPIAVQNLLTRPSTPPMWSCFPL